MSNVVNLNRFRKQRQRLEDASTSAANRAKFGRSRIERSSARTKLERESRDLDGKRLDAQDSDDQT
jgi:hypothetical protein